MSERAVQKEDLLAWVNAQGQLDVANKFILYRLAMLADGDCCAWAKVETLAEAVNMSVRTVQYRLRALAGLGMLAATGRTHRLKASTRSVPIYQLAPEVEGLGKAVSMGAESAPIEAHGCKAAPGMGAKGLHPHKELNGTDVGACAPTARAGANDPVGEALAAYPADGGATSEPKVRRLWPEAAAEAGGDAALLACIAAFAADPLLKRRDYGAPSLQKWLSEKRWRAYLAKAGEAAGGGRGPARRAAFACAKLRAAVAAETGESWTSSWLDPCGLDGKVIVPPRQLTADTLNRQIGPLLRAHGYTIGAVGAPQSSMEGASS